MKDFTNKIAVVTGGGTGMGRELVCQLIAAGAHVAMCDVSEDNMAETQSLASKLGAGRLTSHRCDVSNEQDVLRFRDEVAQQHDTQHINLLFNNAGIAGGGSVIDIDRREWGAPLVSAGMACSMAAPPLCRCWSPVKKRISSIPVR